MEFRIPSLQACNPEPAPPAAIAVAFAMEFRIPSLQACKTGPAPNADQ